MPSRRSRSSAPLLPGPVAGDGLHGVARGLRDARTCYSHLAGRLGVALADALVAGRWMEEDGRSYRLTPAGTRALRALGIEVRGRLAQPAARRCLDWTERRPHVAGPVGTALATPRARPWLGAARPGDAGGRRHAGGAHAAREGVQRAMGGEDAMITLSIRYTIDARKRADFEQYARALGSIIPRCGGAIVGYWLPTKFAGPTNAALALIDFPSLAAYEQYRERLAKDGDNIACVRRADESGCILVEDRAILERV